MGGASMVLFVAVDGELDGGHAVASLKIGPAMAGFRDSVPAVGDVGGHALEDVFG